MFKQIKRANQDKKFSMRAAAEEITFENDFQFTGKIEKVKGSGYTAEFTEGGDPYYGWAIEKVGDEIEIDFVFGEGQMIFNGDYVITEEDYYETIGAGI